MIVYVSVCILYFALHSRPRDLMWHMRLAASFAGRSPHAWRHSCATCLCRRSELPSLPGQQAWRTREGCGATWRGGERLFCLQAQRPVLQQARLAYRVDSGVPWPWWSRGECSRRSGHVACSTKAPRPTAKDLVKRIGKGTAHSQCFELQPSFSSQMYALSFTHMAPSNNVMTVFARIGRATVAAPQACCPVN